MTYILSKFAADFEPVSVETTGSTVIELLKEGNESAFEQVFKENFKRLHAYALTFLKDDVPAEEIVQEVFCRIWEKKDRLDAGGSLKAYLYRAVHNGCLNYLKHHKVKAGYEQYYTENMNEGYHHTEKKVLASELERHIGKALAELPPQCRTIFQLSRFEHLKYQQIADHLNLSVKTVENQMGKALRLLRLKLVEFLPLFLILLLSY